MFKPALLSLLLLAFVPCGYASTEITSPPLGDIRAQQLEIRERASAGTGEFKDMSRARRGEIVGHQEAFLRLVDGKNSLDDLNAHDKLRAFNMLEQIKAAITGAEDDRLVCERTRRVGTNRVERICATVAERRAMREQAEKYITQRSWCGDHCTPPPGPAR